MTIKKSEVKWILYLEGIEIFLKYKGKSKWALKEMAKSDLAMFKDHKTAKRWYQNCINKQMGVRFQKNKINEWGAPKERNLVKQKRR